MKLNDIRCILAIIILILIMMMAFGLFSLSIPTENKDLVNFLLGGASTWCGTIIGHYFGDPDKREGRINT